MNIYLRDLNPKMVQAWQMFFSQEKNVYISQGPIFDEGEHPKIDAIVSPANSFGFMDGGIDLKYSEFFGWEISKKLQHVINCHYNGELLVGQACVIDIRQLNPVSPIPYLISAPTMRVPQIIDKTVNAYLAFKAVLKIAQDNSFKSILCPGLGTATGKMPFDVCAAQMFEAYKGCINFDSLRSAYIHHCNLVNGISSRFGI